MSTTTTRGHLKNKLQANEVNDARITRPSRWGNDFQIGEDHPDTGLPMTRDDVCDLFEQRQLPFMDVEPLRGKRLLCSCPLDKRCHGDSIIKKLEETPMNLRNDKLHEAAELITKDHEEIQQLMATAEERAKAIGQKLVDLKPILKERGTNLTDFCKDYLPFGKSTAYDYIKIAKGKVTWEDHIKRGNSEPSEKPGALPPTLEQHADAMGVPLKDVEGWEETRQATNADPELSKKVGTFEGYMKAKRELEKPKTVATNAPGKPKNMSLDDTMRISGANWDSYAAAGCLVSTARDLHLQEDSAGMVKEIMHFLTSREDRHSHPYNAAGLVALVEGLTEHLDDLKERSEKMKQPQKIDQRREAIRNTVPPKVIDLDAMARDTTNTDIRKIGPAFIALMETLCTKFDRKDIERELTAFMEPDPLGLKVKALHTMAEILIDLCGEYPLRSQEKSPRMMQLLGQTFRITSEGVP